MKILLLLTFLNLFLSAPVFAIGEDKVGNVNYLKILQDKESAKKQDYGFEIEGAGLYLAPTITTISADKKPDDAINSSLESSSKTTAAKHLNYQLNSDIGININQYFTAFLAYDLGEFGINGENNNINFGIDSSTIKLNGFGSKINFSKDFYLKMMYFENELDEAEQNNLNFDKERQMQLKGVINF